MPKYKKYLDMVELDEEMNYLSINQMEDLDRKKARYDALNRRKDDNELWEKATAVIKDIKDIDLVLKKKYTHLPMQLMSVTSKEMLVRTDDITKALKWKGFGDEFLTIIIEYSVQSELQTREAK